MQISAILYNCAVVICLDPCKSVLFYTIVQLKSKTHFTNVLKDKLLNIFNGSIFVLQSWGVYNMNSIAQD